jgi:hypothetical protein
MFYVVVAAGFEYVYKTYNVAVDVSMGVFDTIAYAGLGGEVTHLIEFFLFEEFVELFSVFEVHTHKAVIGVGCALNFGVPDFGFPAYTGFCESGVFEVYIVVVVDVINTYYGVASFEEALGKVEADKTSCSCY